MELPKGLNEFPRLLDSWSIEADHPIDGRVQEVLGATDLLDRSYYDAINNRRIGLFIAFFSSQRKGGAIHSPKNCLPGAGWEPVSGGIITIAVPGSPKSI